MTCPLLYRFRVIDRLPETPSVDAARGTVVHKVLEDLYALPAGERTLDRANELVGPAWEQLAADEPELATLLAPEEPAGDTGATSAAPSLATWLNECRGLLDRYFQLEEPGRLDPAEREAHVDTQLDSGLRVHGYIDRVDINADGDMRIVDYKTGRSPDPRFESKALFQMKFYALVVWRTRGVVPRLLKLIYLGNAEVMTYAPDEGDLLATECKIDALWRAIQRATETGDWRPRRSALCAWCDHQAICPEWGGTPPPLPKSTPDPDARSPRAAVEGST